LLGEYIQKKRDDERVKDLAIIRKRIKMLTIEIMENIQKSKNGSV